MNQPTSPAPLPYSFNGPDDKPAGVDYQKTDSGFKASASSRSLLISILFCLLLAGIGLMVMNTMGSSEAPTSFFVSLAISFLLSLTMFAYFTMGRESIEIKGELLLMKKSLFGLGITKSLPWRKIMRAQVVRRTGFGMAAMIRPNGSSNLLGAKIGGQLLEVETDTHIKTMGSNLSEEHLYYFRHLIVEAVKASRQPSK